MNPVKEKTNKLFLDMEFLMTLSTSLVVPQEVVVVGGGYWGKIITKTLSLFQPDISKIHLVSNRNYEGNNRWVKEVSQENSNFSEKVAVSRTLDTVIKREDIEAFIVANFPADHYVTTKRLLEVNKHVLIEKPFVPCLEQANELIQIAKEKRLTLAVGLEFMMASYLYYFRTFLEKNRAEVEQVTIVWQDQVLAKPHGITKTPDMTVTVFSDIFPHILSILTVLFGYHRSEIEHISIMNGVGSVMVSFRYGFIPVTVNLSRCSDQRNRYIKVLTQDKKMFTLNFTKEPGNVFVGGEEQVKDPYSERLPGTLNIEFAYFFRKIQEANQELPFLAENTVNIVEATGVGNRLIIQQQVNIIRNYIFEEYPTKPGTDVIIILREYLIRSFLQEGLIKSPKDEAQINWWSSKVFILVHKLSYFPFTTQEEVLQDLGITKGELVKLNVAVRSSPFVQSLILKHGHGSKYWLNTIIPLTQAGIIDATVRNEYHYPFRIGIYMGVSCMFFCSFCGRNYNAKYDYSIVSSANELIKKLFKDAPKDDPYKFYISGGLEPLTNPGIGEVVRYGREQGFKLSLYTNGFLLTPDLLNKQLGLWDLSTLRISLFGVNEETALNVNKKKNSFIRVIKNAKSFLRLRDVQKASVKFGLNFVILPGCAEQVLQLAEIIAEINRESGADRQVDFLTLREDYSFADNGICKSETRANLIEVFKKLEERRQKDDLHNLYIDYGYALHSASLGKLSPTLYMVNYQDIRPRGYPQISVVIDLLGDVYLYREAGFLERPGANRYKIGRVSESKSLESVVREYVESGKVVEAKHGDTKYFDAFDHLTTMLLNQAEADTAFGIPFDKGPVQDRIYNKTTNSEVIMAHPSLPSSVRDTSVY